MFKTGHAALPGHMQQWRDRLRSLTAPCRASDTEVPSIPHEALKTLTRPGTRNWGAGPSNHFERVEVSTMTPTPMVLEIDTLRR